MYFLNYIFKLYLLTDKTQMKQKLALKTIALALYKIGKYSLVTFLTEKCEVKCHHVHKSDKHTTTTKLFLRFRLKKKYTILALLFPCLKENVKDF